MKNTFFRMIAPAFVVLFVLLADSAIAQKDERPKILDLRVGFDNRYKVGNWVPVKITFLGGTRQLTGAVTLTVPDGDGIPSQVTTPGNRPLMILPGQETTVSLFARFGRVDSTATVRFIVDGKVVAEREFESHYETAGSGYYRYGMNATQPLYLVVGAAGVGLQKAATLVKREREEPEPVVVRIDSLENLPTRWYGYEGVDAIVLSTSRPEIYSKLMGADDVRLAALDEWIRMGGKLVLSVGANAEDVLGAGMPLARFAPGKLDKMEPWKPYRAWEAYTGGSAPFPKSTGKGKEEKVGMSVPRLKEISGKIVAKEADLPLIIRSQRGFGQIIFVAADLDREPMNKWADRGRLVAKMLGMPISTDEKSNTDTTMMHFGYQDISGQLRSALDRFTGVRLVPFGVVIVLVLIYIILIGPVDYFFLKKFVGRMQWTWITFPLIVLIFSVGAYYLAYYLKGDQLRVNQVDLVDVDTTTGFARGTSWANIFSPRMEAYNLTFQPNDPDGNPAEDAHNLTAWLGLPGSGLGGMNQPARGGSVWQSGYGFSPDLDAMLGVPIQVWSTKSIMGRWHAECKDFPRAKLSLDSEMLAGRITNTFDFPLEKCILAYDRWVYEFGTIDPGETVRIKDAKTTQSLKTLLTGRRTVQSDDEKQVHQQATPYDGSSTNIDDILREMMFFKASGGKRYSHLTNNYQPFVDFSEIINLNRAVLVGYGPETNDKQPSRGGAVLLDDGQPLPAVQNQHKTVYRFVFEVNVDDKNTKSN
ncbi:MAG: hypothetical protein JXM70_03610 [Pirellulales bacterium]|nr:hypothetical protein [Pirellulales bacterium]